MLIRILILFTLVLFIYSCRESGKEAGEEAIFGEIYVHDDTAKSTTSAPAKKAEVGFLSLDSTTITGIRYKFAITEDYVFFIFRNEQDTIYIDSTFNNVTNFDDFDGDGIKDIRFHVSGNTDEIERMVKYDRRTKKFVEVDSFSSFPAAKRIGKTPYFYSYHKSGCADMTWDSDLFTIKNFKAIRLGNINGNQCEGDENGVFIYKCNGEEKRLYKKLPSSVLGKYEDYKWGFIKEYWTNNYNRFVSKP